MLFLGRFFWELELIQKKPSFDLSYLPESEKTDFMQCMAKVDFPLKDCFKLYKENNDIDKYLLSDLLHFRRFAIAFDISDTENISDKLISSIFYQDIDLKVKDVIMGYLFSFLQT